MKKKTKLKLYRERLRRRPWLRSKPPRLWGPFLAGTGKTFMLDDLSWGQEKSYRAMVNIIARELIGLK